MQPAPSANPNLPGLKQGEIAILSEKLHTIGGEGFYFCQNKCVTHFGEDALPYHPGEKACLDRCMSKLYNGFDMAKGCRSQFAEKVKNDDFPFQWMKELTK